MCEVTIVIPNYNGEKYLLPCLKALYEKATIPMEVLIVDNGSTDSSVAEAKQTYPQTKFIRFDKNMGFCKAVNEGIRAAATDYVLLLNNDTEIKHGFVEHLLQAIKQDEKIFSVEAKMLQYQDQTCIDSAGTFYNALGWAFARGKDQPQEKYEKAGNVFAACGGAAIYRKSVFDEIGYFDERHFAYLEDIDIGYRARIFGYKNRYEPQAKVIHVGSASSGSRYNEFKTRYSARNNIYLIYKNMPIGQMILNLPLLTLGFVVKGIFFYRKKLGKVYVNSLLEGIHKCKKREKVSFQRKHLLNYCKIQLELWENIIRRFL